MHLAEISTGIVAGILCSPGKRTNPHSRQRLIQQQFELGAVFIVDADQQHPILGQQVAGEQEPSIHELKPLAMFVEIVLVYEVVVVDEILVAGVIRGINTDAFYPARMGHAQIAQRVEVVPFDEEIAPGARTAREFADCIKSDKILIERAVKFNIVPLPDQPEFRLTVAILNDFYQLFFGVSVVFGCQRGVSPGGFFLAAKVI